MSQVPPPPQPFPQQPAGGFPPPPQGYPPQQLGGAGGYYAGAPAKKTNGPAIGSLICGILGCVPILTGLAAVVLGIVGLRKAKDPQTGGKGLAIAGIILGVLSIGPWSLFGGGAYWAWQAGKPTRDLAKAFANDLAAGKVDAAQARCTTNVTREELDAAAVQLKALGALQDTTIFSSNIQNNNGVKTAAAGGIAQFAGQQPIAYTVAAVEENGQLKIDGFAFVHNNVPIGGGNTPQGAPGR